MSELKPCPFCNCPDVKYAAGVPEGPPDKGWRSPHIVCEGCGIGVTCGSFGPGMTDEEVKRISAEAWNRRDSDIPDRCKDCKFVEPAYRATCARSRDVINRYIEEQSNDN